MPENKIKKISWFRRIFMSWDKLVDYFFSRQEIQQDTKIEMYEKRLLEQDSKFKELLLNKDQISSDKDQQIGNLRSEIGLLKEEKAKLVAENDSLKSNKTDSDNKSASLDEKNKVLENQLQQYKSRYDDIVKEKTRLDGQIANKLEILAKIDRIYFGSTGNKGKGEFGEMYIKLLLEKNHLYDQNIFVENLNIPNTKGVVEFAIKIEQEKFVPIDSKVLEPKFGENNEPIIDENFVQKIRGKAKEIKDKYLDKKNTASYGIMVLSSDVIYSKVWEFKQQIFNDVSQEFKIVVLSPSTFIQFAWLMHDLNSHYEQVKNLDRLYNDVFDLVDNRVRAFASDIQKLKISFDKAVDTHYRWIEEKSNKICKRYSRMKKSEDFPKITEQESDKENEKNSLTIDLTE